MRLNRPDADRILKVLKETFPKVRTQLAHSTPFELLVATILSAQCTDQQVNRVTKVLFENVNTPAGFATMPSGDLEALIRPAGLHRSKARHLQACARALLARHDGQVPASRPALTALPGVGRKTANVVLGAAFGIPAIVVDTHVTRTSRRLGLSGHQRPEAIERDLMALLDEAEWHTFSLRLIALGRSTCRARIPRCPQCPLTDLCRYPEKPSL